REGKAKLSNLSAPAKNKNLPKGRFFVFEWGKGSNSAREFDAKRKAGFRTPVAKGDEREGKAKLSNLSAPAKYYKTPEIAIFLLFKSITYISSKVMFSKWRKLGILLKT
ncbi:MAG: hypothetical protein J6N49_04290, partial [Alphaproteobacteria bacterium]|nr:hypothetical protein [Alphaproteobacteria bacterium]